MNFIFTKNNKRQEGFTLVETLVALSIFSISIVSVMVFLGKGIADTSYAKKKVTAEYLAQEGIEYIRNMRDTYLLYSSNVDSGWANFNGKLFGDGFGGPCSLANGYGCYFDDSSLNYSDSTLPIIDITLTPCSNSTCSTTPLLYNSTTGKYGYGSGTNSGFSRKINITQPGANETKVTSTVYWTHGSTTYNVNFSETLFKWIEL